ncbi:hypothetical protein SLEP1_g34299 [Rubroshorea leprosula]|uniref:Reverse transcriptase Ty1/copia-type domain-containing protein n=1 Tax=Rubroshorea leprosula TaxID=152421 RepID=A0AAV5KJF5_9ROSI|nr:hypothetical protein SLEP1_g34299 [Rubroshorea leprosula]
MALSKNQTWTLVLRHSSMNVIGSKWVYKTNLKADGSLERLKARLIAKGFNQQAGIDYEETFSSVIKPQTIRIVLTISLAKGWTIKQLDFQNAFLHGYLTEPVYMNSHLDLMTQLIQIMYVKSTEHFMVLNKLLEPGLNDSATSYFNLVFYAVVVIHLYSFFIMLKKLGNLSYFLGIQVYITLHGLFLSQKKYAQELLKCAGMIDCKAIATPMVTKSLALSHVEPFSNPSLF